MSDGISPDDLAQVEVSIRDFMAAEAEVTRARQQIELARQAVLDMVSHLRSRAVATNDPALIGVLRHIYWQQRGIKGRVLAEAAGFHLNEMLAAIGPCPSGIPCAACGTDLPRTSRSWSPGRYGPPLCTGCESDKRDARNREHHVRDLRARLIGGAPVLAAAQDWRAACALVLAYPPLSHWVERGSENDRQVGAWLGWENAQTIHERLMASAPADDEPFSVPAAHTKTLIDTALQVAGWDTARTRDLLDPITHESAHSLLTRLKQNLMAVVRGAKERTAEVYPDDYEPNDEEVRSTWDNSPTWWDYR